MLRRGALIGVMVGILGITAALAVGYPAGAKPAKGPSRAVRENQNKGEVRQAARPSARRPGRSAGAPQATGQGPSRGPRDREPPNGTARRQAPRGEDNERARHWGGVRAASTARTGTGAVTGTGTATGTAGATTTSTGTTETTGTGTTGARPVVEGESASHLTPTDAVLEGAIDDQGLEASYEFHLVTAPPCLTAKPPCEIAQRLFSTPAGKLLGSPLGQDVSVDLNTAGITSLPGAR